MWTCVFMPDDNIILTLVGWDMTFILYLKNINFIILVFAGLFIHMLQMKL